MREQSRAREHESSRIILPYTQRPLLKEGFGKGEYIHEIFHLLGKSKGLVFLGQSVNEAGSSENSDGMTPGLSLMWKT